MATLSGTEPVRSPDPEWATGRAGNEAIALALSRLGRWAEGRFVVQPDADAEVVPAEHYLDLDNLRAGIARASVSPFHSSAPLDAADPDDVNLQVAVSRFTRHYCGSLTLVAAVGLARGVGIDLSAARCRMVMFANLPFRSTIELADGPTVETMAELREFVWRKLYGEHLAPLFARIQLVTRITDRVIWTNAAEWWGMASDAAEEYLGEEEARRFVEERDAILGAPSLPGVPGPNPLAGRLAWEPTGEDEFPTQIQTREACCLCYLLGDRLGRLCQNCPFLPLEDRVALVRERHGVPMGSPGGPAEKVAIERGLEKLRVGKYGAVKGAR